METKIQIMTVAEMEELFKKLDALSPEQRKEVFDNFLDNLRKRYCLNCGTQQCFFSPLGCSCWNDE